MDPTQRRREEMTGRRGRCMQ